MRTESSVKDFILPAFWFFCLLLFQNKKPATDKKIIKINQAQWLKGMPDKNYATGKTGRFSQ